MNPRSAASLFLAHEAGALLARLAKVRSYAGAMPMVPAAALAPEAQTAIEQMLSKGRTKLSRMLHSFLRLATRPGRPALTPEQAQRRFTFLRLQFHAVLTQFDIFADVLNQRSEHDTGVWLAGLDVLAADALSLPRVRYRSPPVVCYLDRGIGAAIRRARTRLPGGAKNPVAVIRVPRERMIGSGVASSLVHEVGHQAAALLNLAAALRTELQGLQRIDSETRIAWCLLERWIWEILADFWSVARVGIASTLGLLAVTSLPRAFVFRLNPDDPHPVPYIRVKLSCAMGQAMYPHPQWGRLVKLWESFYPLSRLDPKKRHAFAVLEKVIPGFVTLLLQHRAPALRGRSLLEAMVVEYINAIIQKYRMLPTVL